MVTTWLLSAERQPPCIFPQCLQAHHRRSGQYAQVTCAAFANLLGFPSPGELGSGLGEYITNRTGLNTVYTRIATWFASTFYVAITYVVRLLLFP
ncbi:hypothetical protein PILCRDRAFT_730404 [Piloderma croceum F 1598]|uniref:Uncharacterized protein n=1 Tax=Piloderma croceum (strain F 1598) TaxID=765440 RepID=A0A0C3EZG0_PILCF|nr:hypothetical protein PILCRDRAFT_730404 [Piloderma croceum F 1598]